jgi:hypothetical protein
MIAKGELLAIRSEFSIEHVYSLSEYHKAEAKRSVEVDHFDGATFILIACVYRNCRHNPVECYHWLFRAIFGRTTYFRTGKDVHVHVLTALETIINIAQEA